MARLGINGRVRLILVSLLLGGLLVNLSLPPASANSNAAGLYSISGNRFVDGSGSPVFLFGANYEGNNDRAWLVWESSLFDPALIESNFALAEKAGLNTLRIFVQPALRDSINFGDWGKLDTVAEIARRHNLVLLLTFQDYTEVNVQAEANFEGSVAARYRDNPAFLGFDLRNELQLSEVAGAQYAEAVPLQQDDFVRSYGERVSQAQADAFRATPAGSGGVPKHLDARQGYSYLNALKLWDEFQAAGIAWAGAHPGKSTMDYLDAPESGNWQPFLAAVNGTLDRWVQTRLNAIRAADGGAIVTLGWNNPALAKLPANNRLSFISYHSFPLEGYDGAVVTMGVLENLRNSYSNVPIVLEEFGYSNLRFDGSSVSQSQTANHEMALWLYLYWRGFAGGYKWMLTNWTPSLNKFEAGLGLLDDNNSPKLAWYALKALSNYAQDGRYTPDLVMNGLQPDGPNISYTFSGKQSLFSSAYNFYAGPVHFQQEQASPFAAWWPASGLGEIYLLATSPTQVTVNLDNIFPNRNRSQALMLTQAGGEHTQLPLNGAIASFKLQPGQAYTLAISNRPTALDRAQPGAGLYFKETGHNLAGTFRAYWERTGGLALYGFPLSEEFSEVNSQDGRTYTVQYFERARFEYHPENRGTAFEVLLGHLGRAIATGRENEGPFQRIAAISPDRSYYKESGHSLGGAFRAYWERNGGLPQFGFPISEEFQELNPSDGKTYAVQYFERARFEYHPENRGTAFEVLLGHLGKQILQQKGWI